MVMPVVDEVAKPLEPTALLMVALVSSEDFQVTNGVRSCGGPAVNIPVAINCCFVPRAILGLTGVTPMDNSVAGVTISVVFPNIPEVRSVAVIVIEGALTADEVASPLKPAALLMVATVSSEDFQDTDDVRFCVVASVNIPVAINCSFVPRAILGLTGVTPMDTSVALVTVSVAVPTFPVVGSLAVIVMGPPMALEVASPEKPTVLLMVATAGFEEVQVTDCVRSLFVLFE